MPLLQDASDESLHANIAEMIKSGHPRDQAVAAAYSIQRKAEGEPEDETTKAEIGRFLTEHEVRGRAHDIPPTQAQLKAGNYPKHHWKMHGMDIAIENPAGTKRSGVNHKGEPWEMVMPYHYGYIKGTEGADGDHLDVAVGPLMGRGTEAHIFNQRNHKGGFDEHKVFIGYPTREDAIHAFRCGRSDNPDDVMGEVITISIDHLKDWIASGKLKREAVVKAEVQVADYYRHNKSGKIVFVPAHKRHLLTKQHEQIEFTGKTKNLYEKTWHEFQFKEGAQTGRNSTSQHGPATNTIKEIEAEDKTENKQASRSVVPGTSYEKLRTPEPGEPQKYDIDGFHTTTFDRLDSILKNGLRVKGNPKSSISSVGSYKWNLVGRAVYLHQTFMPAEIETGVEDGVSSIQLEIKQDIPADALLADPHDEDANKTKAVLDSKKGNICSGQPIKPGNIKAVHVPDTAEYREWAKNYPGVDFVFHDFGNQVAKAIGKAHVKEHYRVIGGKVIYVHGYDKTTHGEMAEATLAQRTVRGVDSKGGHYIRATDQEDADKIAAWAKELGVAHHHHATRGKFIKANHHGRTSTYPTMYFDSEEDAKKVHEALTPKEGMAEGEVADPEQPKPPTHAGPDQGPAGPDRGPGEGASPQDVKDDMQALAGGFCAHFDSMEPSDYPGEQDVKESYEFNIQSLSDLAESVPEDAEISKFADECQQEMMHSLGRAILDGGQERLAKSLKYYGFFEQASAMVGRAATLGGDALDTARNTLHLFSAVKRFLGKDAHHQTPYEVGAGLAGAKALFSEKDKMAPFMAGYSNDKSTNLGTEWYGLMSGLLDMAQKRFTTAQNKASDEMAAGQKDVSIDLSNQGYAEPYGFERQRDAFGTLAKLSEGAGQTAAIQAFLDAMDNLDKQVKEAKTVSAYMKVDPAKALEHAGSLKASGDTEGARHQYMLAAMAYHHRATINGKMGKAYNHFLEAAQQAAANAHAIG